MARAPRRTPAGGLKPQRETPLHIRCATLLKYALPPPCSFFHCPNGGRREPREAAKLKAMGVMPGVADLGIMMPRGRIGWIEIKTDEGDQDVGQIEFERLCRALGAPYEVCRSEEEVAAVCTRWLAPLGLTLRARLL